MNFEEARRRGLKIGYTVSSFDVLHSGHIAMLAEARAQCDYLVVGLISDPTISKPDKNKPIQSLLERWMQITAVRFVDEVIPVENDEDIVNSLLVVRPNVRILGDEYKDSYFIGNHLDIPCYFNERKHSFSSSDLRKRIEDSNTEK